MEEFKTVIEKIDNELHKDTFLTLLNWVGENYPQLDKAIKWSQPCFEHKGTFIIAFTPFKGHIAVNLEKTGIEHFTKSIEVADYTQTEMTFRIKWNQAINYDLISEMIEFQLKDKEGYTTYWRKDDN